MPNEFIPKIPEVASTVIIAMFGGSSYHLYNVSKGQPFKWSMFILNMLLAGFIGYVVGKFISPSDFRDGIIAISGFSAFPILSLLEQRGFVLFFRAVGIDAEKGQPPSK